MLSGKGLNKYYFSEADVKILLYEMRQETLIPVKDFAKLIGARHEVAASWIKRGFIIHKVVGGKLKIKLKNQIEFQDSFITLGEIKKSTNISMKKIVRILSENGVKAKTGPTIDGENGYLYVRSEVLPFLNKL